jgi:hypothetical protein
MAVFPALQCCNILRDLCQIDKLPASWRIAFKIYAVIADILRTYSPRCTKTGETGEEIVVRQKK